MTKKGENIYKRKDGRWEGRYIKGRNSSGKIHYGYVYAITYKDVKKKLTIKKASYFLETNQSQKFSGTVEEWCEYWLKKVAHPKVKLSTFNSYQNKVTTHICPAIGSIRLENLTTEQLDFFIQQLEKRISASSVHAVFRVLKTSLKCAEKQKFITSDIYENVTLPKIKKKKRKTLTISDHKKLLNEVNENEGYLSILIALETGMRIGEIAGLKWKDIDFERRTLSIKRTLQRLKRIDEKQIKKTAIIEGKPKSEMSERTIPLSEKLFCRLKQEKKKTQSEYVISNGDKYVEPRTISYQFQRLLKELELESYSFHTLRHSFATRCLEKGVNIAVISSLLGHASTKMTLDIYINSNLMEERAAIDRLSNL